MRSSHNHSIHPDIYSNFVLCTDQCMHASCHDELQRPDKLVHASCHHDELQRPDKLWSALDQQLFAITKHHL
jgi:hypothetical protein